MTPDDRSTLIEQYRQGPVLLRAAYDEAPPAMLAWKPAPDEWSIHEIVCHCADTEIVASTRIRMLLAEPAPQITAFDQDIWANTLHYDRLSPDVAFTIIQATRAWTTPLLADLSEAQWTRAGIHSAAGPYSGDDWLRTFGPHLHVHADQVRDNINAWKRSS